MNMQGRNSHCQGHEVGEVGAFVNRKKTTRISNSDVEIYPGPKANSLSYIYVYGSNLHVTSCSDANSLSSGQ